MFLRTMLLIAISALIVLIIYFPAIYQYIRMLISERRFQRELQAIEDGGLFEESRIVITKPLGLGTEPAGEISFAEAMKNQEFAMKSIMRLIK